MLPTQSTVVNPAFRCVLKLVILVMVLVLNGGSPAIAAHPESTPKAPDDLQSLVMQAADSLDLPLFPLDDAGVNAQVNADDSNNDFEEDAYVTRLRVQQKLSSSSSIEQAQPKVGKP